MYVGKAGTGTLEISAGGRAEIQDAVVVGDAVGGAGTIVVDGFDSFLGSGGFDSGNATREVHQMIVGRQGNGVMTISGGATVDSEASPAGGGQNQAGPVGAVIGSTPFTFSLGQVPEAGGSGTVTVTDTGSKWVVGGSLQVGGFDIGLTGMTIGDPEGNNVMYGSQAGRGDLYVNDGATVTVRNAIGVAPTDTTTSLLLAVGYFRHHTYVRRHDPRWQREWNGEPRR